MFKPQNTLYGKTTYCTDCFSTSIIKIKADKKYMQGVAEI
jgi:hypothetical protein